MTTMREYVDGIQGEGAWDRMHDKIAKMDIFGWEMPPIEVDGHKVHIFPGANREASLERVQAEVRKALASIDSRKGESVEEWAEKLAGDLAKFKD